MRFNARSITPEMAELLFAIEAALPFVAARVGGNLCSSSGSPFALKKILLKYKWDQERSKWIYEQQPTQPTQT